MTLATLNVVIDPTKASSGATAAVQAAKAVESALRAAGDEAKKLGGTFNQMQQQVGKTGGIFRSAFSGLTGMVSNVAKGVLGIGAAFGALYAAMLPIMALVKGLTAGFSLLMGAINGAADFEDYTIQFAGLLGSFEKADAKLKELSDIAAKTPFNLPEIVKGTITLQTLSDGALVARDKLTMIGDAAAKAKQPFDVMAESIGRVFIAAKTGGELIEQLKTLTAQGVIGAEAFVKIKALGGTEANANGKNFLEIWKAVTGELQKAKGQMELMSQSTNGLFSTLQDSWAGFQRIFGASLNQGVRPILRSITEEIDSWSESLKEWAPIIADVSVQFAALINVMRQNGGLKLAFDAAVETLEAKLTRIMRATGIVLKNQFELAVYDFKAGLTTVQSSSWWKNLFITFENLAATFINAMSTGLDMIITKITGKVGDNALVKAATSSVGMLGFLKDYTATILEGGTQDEMSDRLDKRLDKYAQAPVPTGGVLMPIQPLVPNNTIRPAPVSFSDAMNQVPEEPSVSAWALGKQIAKEALKIGQANDTSRDNSLLPPIDAGPEKDLMSAVITADAKAAKKAADDMEKSAKKFIDATRTPAEQLQVTLKQIDTLERAGKLTADQAGRARVAAQEDYQKALKKTENDMVRLGKLENGHFQQLMNSWSNMSVMVDQASVAIAHSFTSNIANNLTDMITGTKSVSEAFSNMAKAIISDIIRMTIQLLIMRAIGGVFGGAAGAVLSGVNHTGGTVGDAGGMSRSVPASTFANAPRYQHGGSVTSGESPIIAEKGETVLTRSQSSEIKRRLNGDQEDKKQKQTGVTIVNVTDPRMVEQAIAKDPNIILNAIQSQRRVIKKLLA